MKTRHPFVPGTLLYLSIVALACGYTSEPVEATIELEPGTGSLDATVRAVRVGDGTVHCALHNSADHFPNASPIIGGSVMAAPDAASVTCLFEDLPPGDYAISVYQDENGNGELDYNAFGAPKEGYGASRNELPGASAPTFEDNKVALADGEQLELEITLE